MAEQSKDELLRMKIRRGDDFSRVFNIIDMAGDIVDLTGYLATFTVKENLTDTQEDAKIVKSSNVSSEIDIYEATNGKLRVYIDATDTVEMDPKTYHYDLQLMDNMSHIHTTHRSTFSVFCDVTTPAEGD